MSNLTAKIRLLVADLDALDNYGRARIIEEFVQRELALHEQEKHLDEQDIAEIRDRATRIFNEKTVLSENGDHSDRTSFAQDASFFRTVCFAEATIELLRGKTWLSHLISFRKGRKHYRFPK